MTETSIGLVFDRAAPDTLATFWCVALGYTHLGSAGNQALLVPE